MTQGPGDGGSRRFAETTCGHLVGAMLLCYAFFNTYLFIKFTPVYEATQCGDQSATLEHFTASPQGRVSVSLEIQIQCWNPNGYDVAIQASRPGHVYVGVARNVTIGNLTLVQGSSVPASGSGAMKVRLDADLPRETSKTLVPHFLSDKEIPLLLDLQFDVGVNVNFGLTAFSTAASFSKKCGMNVAGILVNTANRQSPLVCMDTWEELEGHLPQLDASTRMQFSAAQMDPERIRMGEWAKNVGTISVGSFSYLFGILLTWNWIKCSLWPTAGEDKLSSRRGWFYGDVELDSLDACLGGNKDLQSHQLMGGETHHGVLAQFTRWLSSAPKAQAHAEARDGVEGPGGPGASGLLGGCLVEPVMSFLTCRTRGRGNQRSTVVQVTAPTLMEAPHRTRSSWSPWAQKPSATPDDA